MKFWILLLMFFAISALLIISNSNLSLIKDENIGLFGELYLGWLEKIYSNVQIVTGHVVKMDWMPEQDLNSASSNK